MANSNSWSADSGGTRTLLDLGRNAAPCRARTSGARNFQYCFSVSDAHNKANIGRTPRRASPRCRKRSNWPARPPHEIQLCLATSFTCPFEGRIDPQRVMEIASDDRTGGERQSRDRRHARQAVPAQVSGLDRRGYMHETPSTALSFIGDDTWVPRGEQPCRNRCRRERGRRFTRRPGGCPFAPGASGNIDPVFSLPAGVVHPGHRNPLSC